MNVDRLIGVEVAALVLNMRISCLLSSELESAVCVTCRCRALK